MTEVEVDDSFKWYAVQTASNQELKIKRHLDHFTAIEGLGAYIKTVLVPTKTVMEVKNGKKSSKVHKFYPGYIFLHMQLYDEKGEMLQQVASYVKNIQGVLNFMGGDHPVALKKKEMEGILGQVEETKGKQVLKVAYEVGEMVKIIDGPFLNLTGKIDVVDPERGKLKISVSIFGRFTPVELEYWQVQREKE
ncbi:MAG: transcription termination/antitermination protein NusG [Puniceicoccales bacterium]|jgi:transcriptional antiterminator NusG|nr:transcription termination/antitermination protein NusG [Puniceicoccales bacterium]